MNAHTILVTKATICDYVNSNAPVTANDIVKHVNTTLGETKTWFIARMLTQLIVSEKIELGER